MKTLLVIDKGDYLLALIKEHLGGSAWITKPVMLDKETEEIMTTPEGQPLSFVKEEVLSFGPFKIVIAHCFGIHENDISLPPKEVLVELHTGILLAIHETKEQKQKQTPSSPWENMRH